MQKTLIANNGHPGTGKIPSIKAIVNNIHTSIDKRTD